MPIEIADMHIFLEEDFTIVRYSVNNNNRIGTMHLRKSTVAAMELGIATVRSTCHLIIISVRIRR